jgi:phosphotriesterase-related protein
VASAPERSNLFADGGADLGRVLIGHQDEQTDVAPIRKLAERGTFVGVDRIGLEILAPDERRADHVATLVREGFTEHVCLSQDHICALTAPRSSFYVPPEHRDAAATRREQIAWQVWQRPYTYILTEFVPRLLERGVTDADVETIFVDNPRRLLTGA